MAELETKGMPSSLGAVGLVVGFIAGQLMLQQNLLPPEAQNLPGPFVDYSLAPSSHGEHSDIFARARHVTLSDDAAEIHTFYNNLLSKQEELGSEIEKVLFANLWELYAR